MIEFELLLTILVPTVWAWFILTQVVVPFIRGSHLFPSFSKKRHLLEDEIAAVNQELEAEHLRHELQRKQEQLAKEQQYGIRP